MNGAFDTLATAEALKAAGMEDAHAKAIAGAMRDAITESVATKADISRLEGKVEADIARLESKVEADIARLESKIETDVTRLEGKIGADTARIEARITQLESKIEAATANTKVQVMLFMVAVGGAIVAAVKLIP